MMEWGDYGLKSGEDVLEALHKTRTRAHGMHEVMAGAGTRFTGLMADALDIVITQLRLADELRATFPSTCPQGGCPHALCKAQRAYDDARRTIPHDAKRTPPTYDAKGVPSPCNLCGRRYCDHGWDEPDDGRARISVEVRKERGWDGGRLLQAREIQGPLYPTLEPSEKDDALAKLIHRSMGGTPQEAAARTIAGEDDEEIDRAIQAMKDAGVPLGDDDALAEETRQTDPSIPSSATHWTPASARRAYEPPTATKLVPAPRAPPAGHVTDAVLSDARQALTAIALNAAHLAFAMRTFAPSEHAPGAVAAANEIEAAVFRINELLTRSNMEKPTMEARSKDDENTPSQTRDALATIREHMKRMPFAKREEAPEDYERRMTLWAADIETMCGAKEPRHREDAIGGSGFMAEAVVRALVRYPEHGLVELDKSMKLGLPALESLLLFVLEEAEAYRRGPDWLPRLKLALGLDPATDKSTTHELTDDIARLSVVARRIQRSASKPSAPMTYAELRALMDLGVTTQGTTVGEIQHEFEASMRAAGIVVRKLAPFDPPDGASTDKPHPFTTGDEDCTAQMTAERDEHYPTSEAPKDGTDD